MSLEIYTTMRWSLLRFHRLNKMPHQSLLIWTPCLHKTRTRIQIYLALHISAFSLLFFMPYSNQDKLKERNTIKNPNKKSKHIGGKYTSGFTYVMSQLSSFINTQHNAIFVKIINYLDSKSLKILKEFYYVNLYFILL